VLHQFGLHHADGHNAQLRGHWVRSETESGSAADDPIDSREGLLRYRAISGSAPVSICFGCAADTNRRISRFAALILFPLIGKSAEAFRQLFAGHPWPPRFERLRPYGNTPPPARVARQPSIAPEAAA